VGLTQGHWVLRWQACANRWLQCLGCMLDTFRTGDIDPLVCPVWIVHALNRTQTPVARYPGWHALRDLIDTLRPGPERCIRCYCAALWYASTTSDEIRPRSETFSPRLRAQPESPGLLAIDHSAPLRCGSCSTAGAARTGAAAGGRRPNGGRWKSKSASPRGSAATTWRKSTETCFELRRYGEPGHASCYQALAFWLVRRSRAASSRCGSPGSTRLRSTSRVGRASTAAARCPSPSRTAHGPASQRQRAMSPGSTPICARQMTPAQVVVLPGIFARWTIRQAADQHR